MDVIQTEKELNDSIRGQGGTLLGLNDESFKEWAESLTKEQQELLLERHRGTRNFYKKIMEENRRKEYPNSQRYADAAKKLKIYNSQGKILNQLIKSSL